MKLFINEGINNIERNYKLVNLLDRENIINGISVETIKLIKENVSNKIKGINKINDYDVLKYLYLFIEKHDFESFDYFEIKDIIGKLNYSQKILRN